MMVTRDPRRERLTLTAASLGLVLVMLNVSMVNPALPAIRAALGGGALGQQWTVNTYNLVFASLLLLGGLLGDRYGHRRVLLAGLGVSVAAALASAVAPSIGVLLVARAVQGLGSALIQPATLALLTATFTDPPARARALGLWGAVSGLGIAIGPLAGGLLVDALGWRAVFLAMAPAGLLTVLATLAGVRETPADAGRRPDLAGLALVVASLAALSLSLSEGQRLGFGAPATLVLLGGAALAFAAFLAVEARVAAPLVDLAAFRRPAFAAANMGGLLAFFGSFPLLTYLGIYLQQERGLSATRAGLLILIFPLAFAGASVVGARLLARFGPRLPATTGALIAAAGALGLGMLDGGAPTTALWWRLLLLGAGVGVSMSALTTAAVSSVGRGRTGMAASVLGALRQVGAALGIAVLGVVIVGISGDGPTTIPGLRAAALIAAGALLAAAASAAHWLPTAEHAAAQGPDGVAAIAARTE
ncbi:MAG TPA: MFS transporter [Chloroflexaceae bacterium]|nr:MFS transporter [Chloroflexaceae bacterium]